MSGLEEIKAINAWAASKECQRLAAAPAEKPVRPFRLAEKGGKTFKVYAQGRMVEL